MIHVSEIFTVPPAQFQTPLERSVYETLERLHIPYERVATDEVITMEDCAAINERLNMEMVKTLFLCNRQQTRFYLFITRGDKPFRGKEFSAALGISKVSFAPAEQMELLLGTKIGAATVFSALLPSARAVEIVFDRQVLEQPWYGCSDGTTTGYMKLACHDVTQKLLPAAGRSYTAIQI